MALVLYRPLSFFHPLPVVALDTDQEFTLRRVLQDLGANEPGSFFIGFCEIHACQIVFSCRASRYQVLSGFACRHHDHGRIEDVDALMRCVRLDKMLQDACLGLPAQLFREKLESVAVSIASGTLATSGVNTGYTGWTGWIFSNISSQLRLNLLGPGPLSQTIPQFVFTLVMQAAVLEVRNLVPQMYRFIRGPSQQIVAANNGAPVTFADQDETSVTSGTFIDHDATSATASLAPVYTKCNILLSILPATTKAPQAELGDSDAPRPMRGGPAGVFFNMATRPSTKSVAMAVVSHGANIFRIHDYRDNAFRIRDHVIRDHVVPQPGYEHFTISDCNSDGNYFSGTSAQEEVGSGGG
ncbi:hypothetical protein KVT40_009241 [Elsinoe batatas]|uniref:Uncharacterized protein n=1 Tax=Elsinoe batatas TaxID=2601811 RepID=A0A8K0KSB6_9PEZI|nr:hypothetical protein KVT40_009241 [Elsinoe batatas]